MPVDCFYFGTKAQFRSEVFTGYKRNDFYLKTKFKLAVLHMTLKNQENLHSE